MHGLLGRKPAENFDVRVIPETPVHVMARKELLWLRLLALLKNAKIWRPDATTRNKEPTRSKLQVQDS